MKDSNFIKENNARHMWHPMGHPRDDIENPPWIISHAEDALITDIDGHTTIDGVGGLWLANVGYSNRAIKDAIREQMEKMP